MNTIPQSEITRLEQAIAGLAATITEVVQQRISAVVFATEQERMLAKRELLLTKQQAAEYFGVTLRTIDQWMGRRLLPYYKLGRTVRIPINQALDAMKQNFLISARRRG